MNNKMFWINNDIYEMTFKDGLSRYEQGNCKVTLTPDGCRIYRTPNKTPSSDGNTMWGGIRIHSDASPDRDNLKESLIKNHSYIILYEAKGQTTNACEETGWTNLMGWRWWWFNTCTN